MATDYRNHFVSANAAAQYDKTEYAPRSYSSLLWELEKPILREVLTSLRHNHPTVRYLDFAAGTGRVTQFMEENVDESTAIEISETMAATARQRLHRTRILCRDITVTDEIEGTYQLITAFRFLLNASPELRDLALAALVRRLDGSRALLVFNNHGHLWSVKALGYPYWRLRNLGKGRPPAGNYMTHKEVRRLLAAHHLQIVKRVGLGVLGGKIAGLLPFDRALALEQKLCSLPVFRKLGHDQIYVVRRS